MKELIDTPDLHQAMTAQIEKDHLYTPIEPFVTSYFSKEGHQIYYEISGNSQGPTVLFLHGGPGGGTTPRARRFFNPDFYRIVLMDQRGCGQSVPNASEKLELSLENNTTSALIGDIESLRKIIDIDQWQLIVGGSWGSTLAVAYAEHYPERCRQLLLRGVFTAMPDEVDALFQDGTTGNHYPEEWYRYVQYIKKTSKNWDIEKLNLLAAYRTRLLNPEHRLEAARSFVGYELALSHLFRNEDRINKILASPHILVPFAALEIHYMLHGCFLRRGQLLDELHLIKDLRIHIVHGRNDSVCLPKAAWRFFHALKESGAEDNVTLEFVPASGHSDGEQNIAKSIRCSADKLYQECFS